MDTKTILELEEVLLRFEQIRDLLLMLSDCSLEGANSIEQYSNGINLIAILSSDNTNQLRMLFNKACHEAKKRA